MFEVTVSGGFAASHQLRLPDGSYEPRHGHDWKVKVTYAGNDLNELGMLVDFTALRARLGEVTAALHERHLNELPAFARRQPSAENVARHVAEQMAGGQISGPGPACVEVEEEPGCLARYWPRR